MPWGLADPRATPLLGVQHLVALVTRCRFRCSGSCGTCPMMGSRGRGVIVPGLKYVARYADEAEEARPLAEVDAGEWLTDRRFPHTTRHGDGDGGNQYFL